MSAVLIRNPSVGDEVHDPTKSDGTRFRYEMIFDQGRSRAYADTTVDLLAVLLGPEYAAGSAEEKVTARVHYASNLLAPLQATVLASVDQSTLSEQDRGVLFQPRYSPVVVDEWSCEVPLVLLDVHYAPFSDIPAPISALENGADPRNLVWVRAAEEMDLLMSLDRVGFISLGENNDFRI